MPRFSIRRLFRFNLRTMFVGVIVAAAPAAWVASQRAQSQREIALAEELGAEAVIKPLFVADWQTNERFWHKPLNEVCGPRVYGLTFQSGPDAPLTVDLSRLSEFSRLESLELWSTRVQDLRPIGRLRALKSLTLTSVPVSDLTPLGELPQLRGLALHLHEPTVDLSPLARLQNLQHISISGRHVRDLTPLAALTNLEELALTDSNVHDLTPLVGLSNLRHLYLIRNPTSVQSSKSLSEFRRAVPACQITQ